MTRLFLLMTVVPVIELYLLIQIGQRIGPLPTVALVVITGAVGAALAKREGLRVFRQWQQQLAAGIPPSDILIDGVLVLVGAILLITPGVMTDVLGLALLIRPSRRFFARLARRWAERRIRVFTGVPAPGDGFRRDHEAVKERTAFRRDGESEAELVEASEPPERERP